MLSKDSNTDGSYERNKAILFAWNIFYYLQNITNNEKLFSDLKSS